jgi:hypothetical protein
MGMTKSTALRYPGMREMSGRSSRAQEQPGNDMPLLIT